MVQLILLGSYVKASVHWLSLYVKMAVIWQCNIAFLTFFGQPGQRDADRIISIDVASPKEAKTSAVVAVACCCYCHFRRKNFANVNTAVRCVYICEFRTRFCIKLVRFVTKKIFITKRASLVRNRANVNDPLRG
jgi:hypothetical protein